MVNLPYNHGAVNIVMTSMNSKQCLPLIGIRRFYPAVVVRHELYTGWAREEHHTRLPASESTRCPDPEPLLPEINTRQSTGTPWTIPPGHPNLPAVHISYHPSLKKTTRLEKQTRAKKKKKKGRGEYSQLCDPFILSLVTKYIHT